MAVATIWLRRLEQNSLELAVGNPLQIMLRRGLCNSISGRNLIPKLYDYGRLLVAEAIKK